MSKSVRIRVNYKELQIIKHALQTHIKNKQYNISICEECGNEEFKKKLEHDIKEEEKLLEDVSGIVDDLKLKWNIK